MGIGTWIKIEYIRNDEGIKQGIEIQRECVSERMRITADTIRFVQPFRNILLSSKPKKSSFTIQLLCVLSHAYTHIHT